VSFIPARLPPETASYQRKTPEPARWVRAPWAKEMKNPIVESGKSCCERSIEKPPRPKATWEALALEEKGFTGCNFPEQAAGPRLAVQKSSRGAASFAYRANQVFFLARLGHHRFDAKIESVDQR